MPRDVIIVYLNNYRALQYTEVQFKSFIKIKPAENRSGSNPARGRAVPRIHAAQRTSIRRNIGNNKPSVS